MSAPHWLQGKCPMFSCHRWLCIFTRSQAASRMSSQGQSLWRRLLKASFSKVVSNCKGAIYKLWLWFFKQQGNRKLHKPAAHMYRKYLLNILDLYQKYSCTSASLRCSVRAVCPSDFQPGAHFTHQDNRQQTHSYNGPSNHRVKWFLI